MKKTTEPTPQTIESLKFAAKETNYKWTIAMCILIFTVLGAIGGYFLSINVITDTQSKAVSVFSSAVSKE